MKQNIKLVVLAIVVILLAGCKKSENEPFEAVVTNFYTSFKDDFRQGDFNALSLDLKDLLNQTLSAESLAVKSVEESQYPTEKPQVIDGEIFCSLMDGADQFAIQEIEILGDTTLVKVEFENIEQKIKWVDEVVLIQQNGWKIDNVLFRGNDSPYLSTKELLIEYLHPEE